VIARVPSRRQLEWDRSVSCHVSGIWVAALQHLGLNVVCEASLGIDTNGAMARLSPDELEDWALTQRNSQAGGYFLSCTALRTAELIARVEQRLGRPVLTSKQAMIWFALRDAGFGNADATWGPLMTYP
jgi:maleate isomerase